MCCVLTTFNKDEDDDDDDDDDDDFRFPVKIRRGWARYLSEFYQFGIVPKLLYTLCSKKVTPKFKSLYNFGIFYQN